MKNDFDIVVIGSGMGGLVCADLLGREGYKVCVLLSSNLCKGQGDL